MVSFFKTEHEAKYNECQILIHISLYFRSSELEPNSKKEIEMATSRFLFLPPFSRGDLLASLQVRGDLQFIIQRTGLGERMSGTQDEIGEERRNIYSSLGIGTGYSSSSNGNGFQIEKRARESRDSRVNDLALKAKASDAGQDA